MQGQPGLESKRVSGAESGRDDAGARDRCPQVVRRDIGHRDLDTAFAGVSGSGHGALDPLPHAAGHAEPADGRRRWKRRRQPLGRSGSLNRQDRAVVGGLGAADCAPHPIGVGSVRHHVEDLVVDPPHDDVVENGGVDLVEEMGVLGATGTHLPQIVRERPLEPLIGVGTFDSDGAEVRHVEHDGVVTTCEVFVDRARVVRQWHLPSAEGNHLRAQPAMCSVE